MRAEPAVVSASCSARARAKCPRWLVASCSSHPCGVRCSGVIITPALLTRMSSGLSQADAKAATEAGSVTSSAATATSARPAVAAMSAAVRAPASVLRTASVTCAPEPASARAVSMPMPDDAPVTMARLPLRSMPATTSAAVERKPKGVLIRVRASPDDERPVHKGMDAAVVGVAPGLAHRDRLGRSLAQCSGVEAVPVVRGGGVCGAVMVGHGDASALLDRDAGWRELEVADLHRARAHAGRRLRWRPARVRRCAWAASAPAAGEQQGRTGYDGQRAHGVAGFHGGLRSVVSVQEEN